ncbi:chemotaxis protein MotB [Aequitasia blattaphilus]|uniref:OmpA family protein n=1 Tax=Aequitasia blattaphilus TaxID=2949332 RepID=A0ABT1E9P6_9FIRM|nr:flagellar motor protein MotB [Aequitasia blattaphilus]MCP1102513.1 OmpA family protein [Aequitasia blattaphilus]MCR8615153.1 OmpA family protein [Aequitasia blattaphilus]
MKKREKKQEESGSWMDTYGDMVTLLLCFFVLLYSISSVDQVKWENLVKSMNPEAAEASQIVTKEGTVDGTENVPGVNGTEIDSQFDELYDNLLEIKENMGDSSAIQVAKGDGYQFITFKDSVFFDGDSYILRDEGRNVLEAFASAISPAAAAIKEIQVLGHTTQVDPSLPNETVNDRLLSANRSAMVVSYIQDKNIIGPEKLVSIGYGQHRPISGFGTEEERTLNRRVEMLITKTGSVEKSLNEYYEQVYQE